MVPPGVLSLSYNDGGYNGTHAYDTPKARALLIVGSMGSFEPIDFWKISNLTHYYSQKK